MIRRVEERITRKLISFEETGMGFQVVNATYSNYQKKEVLIINGSVLFEENRDIINLSESALFRTAAFSQVETNIISVETISRSRIIKFSEVIRANRSLGAIDSEIDQTKYGEQFIRFSAYGLEDYKLNRITMQLLPGAFAAPKDDAIYCIDNHININDRYALPTGMQMKYRINVSTLAGTLIKRGTVQPANGWQGGGKEVIFLDGTDENTVTSVENI